MIGHYPGGGPGSRQSGGMLTQNLKPGMEAPLFSLPDAYGREVSLEKYRGRPVALVFIRHLG
jgi:cytochrome oxidase Cu insertion factor (SCO1/SenC/PrrC family)